MKTLYAAKTIEVGIHPHLKILGLSIDYDIALSTLLAMAIVLFLGFRMRAKVTDGVPGKLQLFWEIIVGMVSDLASSAIGPKGKKFVPIGVTVFLFVLVCNWVGFIPSATAPGPIGRDPAGSDERRESAVGLGAVGHRVGARRIVSRSD